jgi:hypothetical protein
MQQGQVQEWLAREQEFARHSKEYADRSDRFNEQAKLYEHLKKTHGETSAKKIMMDRLIKDDFMRQHIQGTSEKQQQQIFDDPAKFLRDSAKVWDTEKTIAEEGAVGYARQRKQESEKTRSHVEIREYGVQKEADTIARAAINLKDLTKKKKLKDPLWVAPENWYEGFHGSHPQEMKEVIQESRKRMVKLLTSPKLKNEVTEKMEENKICNKGMSKSHAEKLAEDHIRATFDIGHLNVWRKYHKGTEKEFDNWMKENVKDLVDNNIIGHVHLSDNFGFYDEHVELGEGNAPLQDFMKILKEKGYKGKMIVEPGGQRKDQTHRIWTSAMKFGQSPVYRIDSSSKTWTDVEGSYFGRTHSPTFMVGDYVPSKDWTLWSEVPFE